MINETWMFLQQQMSNEIFTGAALAGLLLGVLHSARSYVWRSLAFIGRRLVISLNIHSEDPLFVPLARWLRDNHFDQFAKRYRVRSQVAGAVDEYGDFEEDGTQGLQVVHGPDYGDYLFRYKKKWLKVSVAPEENSGAQTSSANAQTREFITISYLGFSRVLLEEILEAARTIANAVRETNLTVRHSSSQGYWAGAGQMPKRPHMPCPVVLPNDMVGTLLKDIDEFFESGTWYAERGIPWRRGYLLHGPPGTGKTSLVRFLAQHYGLNIYVIDASGYSNPNLAGMLRNVDPRSILLFEDIDCYVPNRDDEDGEAQTSGLSPVNIGTLLNAIDGINPVEQVLIVMTTNRIDQLDSALTRPGRIDVRLHLARCNLVHAGLLFDKFFPEAGDHAREAFLQHILPGRFSPADLQELFIRAGTVEDVLTQVPGLSGD